MCLCIHGLLGRTQLHTPIWHGSRPLGYILQLNISITLPVDLLFYYKALLILIGQLHQPAVWYFLIFAVIGGNAVSVYSVSPLIRVTKADVVTREQSGPPAQIGPHLWFHWLEGLLMCALLCAWLENLHTRLNLCHLKFNNVNNLLNLLLIVDWLRNRGTDCEIK